MEKLVGQKQYNPFMILKYLHYSENEITKGLKLFFDMKNESLMSKIHNGDSFFKEEAEKLSEEEIKEYTKEVILLSNLIDINIRNINPSEYTAQNIYRIINSGTIIINLYEIFNAKGYTNAEIHSCLCNLITKSKDLIMIYTGGSVLHPQEIPLNTAIMGRYKNSLKMIESKLQKNRLFEERAKIEAREKTRIYKKAYDFAQSQIFPQSMPLKDRMIYLLSTGQIENKKFSELEVSTIVGMPSNKVRTLILEYGQREKLIKM